MTQAERKKIAKENSSSQTNKALLGIRELIASGLVKGGERLSELALVDSLGLSRTPIRAALSRLEIEGLLKAIPSGGYAVREFSDNDIVDSIELRGALEGMAARFAAERGVTPSKITMVKQVLDDIDIAIGQNSEEMDFDAYVELNEHFHNMLITMAGSSVLQRELKRIVALPFASPSAFVAARSKEPEFYNTLRTAQYQHRSIVEAIESREGARAEALAREHSRLARHNLHQVLEQPDIRNKVLGISLVNNGNKEK